MNSRAKASKKVALAAQPELLASVLEAAMLCVPPPEVELRARACGYWHRVGHGGQLSRHSGGRMELPGQRSILVRLWVLSDCIRSLRFLI